MFEERDEPVYEPSVEERRGAKSDLSLAPEAIVYGSRTAVVQYFAEALEADKTISGDQVLALVQRYFKDYVTMFSDDDRRILNSKLDLPPARDEIVAYGSVPNLYPHDDENPYAPVVPRGMLSQFPDGIEITDDSDEIAGLFGRVVSRLPQDEAVDIARFTYRMQVDDVGSDYYDNLELLRGLAESPHAEACLRELVSIVGERKSQYQFTGRGLCEYSNPVFVGSLNTMMVQLRYLNGFMDRLPHVLASLPEDQKGSVTAVMVDAVGYPSLLNQVRRALLEEPQNPEIQARIESLGRYLLGITDDKPFYPSLQAEYAVLDFENYEPYKKVEDYEIALLAREIDQDQSGTVLELGSGTGRVLNQLASQGYKPLVGVDFSDKHVALAQAADSTQSVRYITADWLKSNVESGSCKTVLSMARSLCHTENAYGMAAVIQEVDRLLAPNGEFIFDMPDPEKGSYHKARMAHLAHIQRLGIPIPEPQNGDSIEESVSYVVDSPTGTDYMNRFVPSFELLDRIFRGQGFDLEEIGRQRIRMGDEAETVYFRAIRRAPSPRLDSILSSLSRLSEDGE